MPTVDFTKLENQKVGILGGSFDPPHLGHLRLAQAALESFSLDLVVFMPAKRNPLKARNLIASDRQRLEMLSLLIEDQENLKLSDLELISEEPSYTVDSLRSIQSKAPKAALYLLLGADNLIDQDGRKTSLKHWKEKDQIFELAEIIIASRGALGIDKLKDQISEYYSAEQLLELFSNLIELDLPVSATKLRTLLAKEQPIADGMLPNALIAYLKKKAIYSEGYSAGVSSAGASSED